MKKINNKGFVLAETLIVTVFILVIFTMLYTNYYPLIGLYEEREVYDDVDGKYVAYWVKQLIENDSYTVNSSNPAAKASMDNLGYIRFECKDVSEDDNKRKTCASLLNALEVSNCDGDGNNCDIFITHYQLGGTPEKPIKPDFKSTINGDISGLDNKYVLRHYDELYIDGELCAYKSSKRECIKAYFEKCARGKGYGSLVDEDADSKLEYGETTVSLIDSGAVSDKEREIYNYCLKQTEGKVFPSYLSDYINYLPDYSASSYATGAKYRVIILVHHKKALNNYYSFSTMEVSK